VVLFFPSITDWADVNVRDTFVAFGLAFGVGHLFTIIPILRTILLGQAAKVTLVGIAAMETVEICLA
jgi:hypothetical protein